MSDLPRDIGALERFLWTHSKEGRRQNRGSEYTDQTPLADIMRARGWRDRDLAAFCDISIANVTALRKLNKNVLRVPLESLIRLSIFLEIPAATIFPGLMVRRQQTRRTTTKTAALNEGRRRRALAGAATKRAKAKQQGQG